MADLVVSLGNRRYAVERPWGALPAGIEYGVVSHVAVDSRDHVYVFQRGDPPVVAYRSASPEGHLLWFDRSGRVTEVKAPAGDYQNPWLSPDEQRIAVERTDPTTGRHTIWVVDERRGITSRLIADNSGAHMPVWSPDGRQIVFNSNRRGGVDLYGADADGSGAAGGR